MPTMTSTLTLSASIPDSLSGERLDRIAAELFPDYSRSVLQGWIKNGELTVDGKASKPKDKHYAGAKLALVAQLENNDQWLAEAIPLDIVYEDEDLLVINKPADWVVHPAAGNPGGTVMNAILHHHPEAATLPRAGIVHRLDKDTTGLMVVAKTLPAHHALVKQLQKREIKREYEALVYGEMTGGGTVNEPIGRHPHHRTKMAVEPFHGKEAVTHYRVKKRFHGITHIDVSLETGRTHQIRVHMSYIKYPIVGDTTYIGRSRIPEGASQTMADALKMFPRQALHARRLGLYHPTTGEYMEWEAELPGDMQQLLLALG
jgi:23S rRNA pseudouridine1911/1915/1917 synthase